MIFVTGNCLSRYRIFDPTTPTFRKDLCCPLSTPFLHILFLVRLGERGRADQKHGGGNYQYPVHHQRLAFRAIKKSSILLPFFRASTNHLGLAPLPAQVSPDRLRYFGGTFRPFSDLPLSMAWPVKAANCFSSSA